MTTFRLRLAALLAIGVYPPAMCMAQQRELLTGIVKSPRGDSIAFARVHVLGGKIDTTVRTGGDGRFNVVVQRGVSNVTASMIGFVPTDTTVEINGGGRNLIITLREVAQQIAAVRVTGMRRGIRGIVGDSTTMLPISGVLISSIARGKKIHTDSVGRFTIDLPVAEQTTIQLVKAGYFSRPATVPMLKDTIVDVVYFMTRGHDPPYLPGALSDLERRAAWRSRDSFIANRDDLLRYGAKTVADGVMEATVAGRRVSPTALDQDACVFIDGRPVPSARAFGTSMSNVDVIEYYPFGTDKTKSLSARWPLERMPVGRDARGFKNRCEPVDKRGNLQPGGPWIVIWTRR